MAQINEAAGLQEDSVEGEKKIRVLLVDDVFAYVPKTVRGMRVELIQPEIFSNYPYLAVEEILAPIAEITTKHPETIDVIVVGNNQGAGLAKVDRVAEALRSKTVVVWNRSSPRPELAGYKASGITRFGIRRDLPALIEAVMFPE